MRPRASDQYALEVFARLSQTADTVLDIGCYGEEQRTGDRDEHPTPSSKPCADVCAAHRSRGGARHGRFPG